MTGIVPHGVFTRRMAHLAGISDARIRKDRQIVRVGSDLYTRAGTPATPGMVAAGLARHDPRLFVSHQSAAELLGITHDSPSALPQLTSRTTSERLRRVGVQCHIDHFGGRGITSLDDLRISSPPRIFVEVAPAASRRRAVALGDHLVRVGESRGVVGFEGLRRGGVR